MERSLVIGMLLAALGRFRTGTVKVHAMCVPDIKLLLLHLNFGDRKRQDEKCIQIHRGFD